MSPKSAPDISYDLPPAGQRQGKTRADSDRHLGNPTLCHRFTLIRDPADTMAPPRRYYGAGHLSPTSGRNAPLSPRPSAALSPRPRAFPWPARSSPGAISVERMSEKDARTEESQDYRDRLDHLTHRSERSRFQNGFVGSGKCSCSAGRAKSRPSAAFSALNKARQDCLSRRPHQRASGRFGGLQSS
jgi:hypothetical protein